MRTTLLGTSVTLLSCALALVAGSAHAQDAAPPPAAPAPAAAPAADAAPPPAAPPPAAEPAPAAPPPEAAPAPAAAPAEAPPAEDAPIPAWIRIDSDLTGLQLWAGATHPLGEGIGLASDIYIATQAAGAGTLGEFDIGPAITTGPFTLTPMLGFQANWSNKKAQAIVPQLYFIGGPDPIYMEFWFQTYLNSVFNEGANNDIYMRLFIDYKVGKYFAFGPEIEPWIALNDMGGARETGLSNFVVGGNVMLSNYGKGSTLLLFLGYETKKAARQFPTADGMGTEEHGLGGRFTYVYNF